MKAEILNCRLIFIFQSVTQISSMYREYTFGLAAPVLLEGTERHPQNPKSSIFFDVSGPRK